MNSKNSSRFEEMSGAEMKKSQGGYSGLGNLTPLACPWHHPDYIEAMRRNPGKYIGNAGG